MNNPEKEITRGQAWELLNQHTKVPHLIKHSLAVEAAMRWYAQHLEQAAETEKWGICGLLHDFDYELHPDLVPPDGHPFFGCKLLAELNYEQDVVDAILGHANYSGVPRSTKMAKALFAVDEMSGFVTACVLVRPDKSIGNLEVKSVLKKMKDKAFAKGCSRDDMILGAQELGIDLEHHVSNMIEALKPVAENLGINL